ncbi:MAG: hypothetical protein AAF609_16125 [Cyanobacteria bacterium P01_C01_bin.120]
MLRMRHEDERVVTVPVLARKIIGKGVLPEILRDAELSKDELIELLR